MQERAKQTPDDEWREVHLGDVIELKRGYDMPKRERISGSIPLVSSSGVTDYHVEAKVRGPGVITGRYGTLGKVFFVSEDFWPLNTTLYVRDFKGNDPRFIAYFLRGLDFSAYQDKAAVPGLNRNHLHEASVRVPPLPEQRAIAHVLGTLDDKIELTRRMNETLEDMARAFFRSWFVDFDPVCAKAALKQHATLDGEPSGDGAAPASEWTVKRARAYLAGMDPQIVDLFPDRLVESELGEIPEGWEVITLGGDFRITMGQSPPGTTYNQTGDGLPLYQGRTDFGFRFPGYRVYCSAPIRLGKAGDTLVSVRAPVGDVNMAREQCCIGRGVAAVRHRSGSKSYTYYSMRALGSRFKIFEADGTVFGAIDKTSFHSMPWVSAVDQLIATFDALCSPLDSRVETNELGIFSLAAQRDALLPQLLSGEGEVRQ